MKLITTTILLLVSVCALGADQPNDGFYVQSGQDSSAPRMMSSDGRQLFLGARRNLSIQSSELRSRNNENTEFGLSVTVPCYDKATENEWYILVVSGTAYKQAGSSGQSPGNTPSFFFAISGDNNARLVSQYLKTPIVYRKHPGHNLLVSFSPAKPAFNIGDEVAVTLRITNVGTNTICFIKGGRNRAARDNQYVFSARYNGRQVEDIGTSYHFGGSCKKFVLKPAEVFEDTVCLSKWFPFDKPGRYEVHGSYYLQLIDPDTKTMSTIWDDYASGDFIVSIKHQEETPNKAQQGIR